MARRIIKTVGGNRIGSGPKMQVQAHGYGYSTHDVSTVLTTQQGFGTIKPYAYWLLPPGSRIRIKMDAMVTSEALKYQLYSTAKLQFDAYEVPWDLYITKLLINIQDQGYTMEDAQFPTMELETKGFTSETDMCEQQINPSALLAELGIPAIGQNEINPQAITKRTFNAVWLVMYYQICKEYYCNKQEGIGYVIHNSGIQVKTINQIDAIPQGTTLAFAPATNNITILNNQELQVSYTGEKPDWDEVLINVDVQSGAPINTIFNTITDNGGGNVSFTNPKPGYVNGVIVNWEYKTIIPDNNPKLVQFDLKAIDRMMMAFMKNVDQPVPVNINKNTELPYGASFQNNGTVFSINTTQEGLCVGTYLNDVNQNWLDNAKINSLMNRTKVQVDQQGFWSIDEFNITQKLYNVDARIAATDGTAEEWFEMTYAIETTGRILKPVYAGGLSKEILFNMVVSTAGTAQEPLGSIASRGTLGEKNKGGYVQVEGGKGKLVMIVGKITPRIVYTQGIHWTNNIWSVDDIHKPGLDKIAYQNRLTDQMFAPDTIIRANGTLITKSIGKQPAWSHYRTWYDRATCRMASTERYKVFGREYEGEIVGANYQLKNGTTYIDPTIFNQVFVDQSLESMPFDIQFGADAKITYVMSEEVIPGV